MADDDFDPDAPLAEEPAEPRAQVSMLTIVLIPLNLVAAGAFLYLLLMTYQVRQEWSYAVLRNYLAIYGLPLADEEQSPAYHVAKPRLRLDPDQVKDAFSTPGRGGKGGGAFAAVDEPVPFEIHPAQMTEQLKKDHFQGQTPAVATLNDEIARLKQSVPGDLAKAAEEKAAALKDEDGKRKAVEQTLLPLAWNVYQVEKLDKRLKEASGGALDKLVQESLERRMYAEVLAPLNVFRPGDVEKFTVEKIADLDAYPVEQLKELLLKRIDATLAAAVDPDVQYGKEWAGQEMKRDSLDKRQQVGLLLFTLSQVRIPLDNTLLYPKGLERAEKVCGLYELALAAQNYARTLAVLEARVVEALENDRAGYVVMRDKVTRTEGFADRYAAEVLRLKEAASSVKNAQERLEDLKGQRDRVQKVYEERKVHRDQIQAKITDTRKETADTLKEVRELQRQLFAAQRTLADAANRNFALEAEIRRLEAKVREGR